MEPSDDQRVAERDLFATDENGVRRLVAKGDRIPAGWEVEQPKKAKAATPTSGTPKTTTRRRAPRTS